MDMRGLQRGAFGYREAGSEVHVWHGDRYSAVIHMVRRWLWSFHITQSMDRALFEWNFKTIALHVGSSQGCCIYE